MPKVTLNNRLAGQESTLWPKLRQVLHMNETSSEGLIIQATGIWVIKGHYTLVPGKAFAHEDSGLSVI